MQNIDEKAEISDTLAWVSKITGIEIPEEEAKI
jgi:hypothetical protein